ncbi:MAG: glycosyltransferase family 2 protein [Candidatus Beckwithbacteria bacterium]
MTISVIIPAYNSAKTLPSCLNSLSNQTLKPLQIILIDDGSTDNTIQVIKQLQKELPKILILTQSHQGPAVARNLGVKKARGDILVFVDSDMEFDQGFLSQLTLPIRKKTAKGTWSGNEWVKNWDNTWARCWNYNQNRRTPRMIGDLSRQRPVFRSVLKSEFIRVKGFDNIGYTDDWTLGSKLGYIPRVTTAKFYHHNPDTLIKVFNKANWIGKRQYKLGKLGTIYTIAKANALFSSLTGLYKSVRYLTPGFFIFKLVYDLGILTGAIQSLKGDKY